MSKPFTIQALPHRHDFRAGCCYALHDARGCNVAVVGQVDAIHDGEPTETNTRLFANAPELLAACKSALRALCDNLEPGPMDADAIAGLRAAIAAAECGPLPTL